MLASFQSMLHRSRRVGQAHRGLPLAVVCLVLVAFGPLPTAAASRSEDLAKARELALAERHAEAAQAYERAARRGFGRTDARLMLLAAREFLAAGQLEDSERALDAAGDRLNEDDQVLAARTRAELELARNRPRAAIQALAALPDPLPAPLAVELLDLRARAEFADGQVLAGVRSFEQRRPLLSSADERAANDRRLLEALAARSADAALPVPPEASEQERGWLELGRVQALATSDPDASAALARDWRTRYPNHPGLVLLPTTEEAPAAAAMIAARSSTRIALLLPLSGRNQAVGEVVRDGFMAAALADPAESRPGIVVIDTAAQGVEAAYSKALADGAGFVVGPLLREDLAKLAAGNRLAAPTLGLNSITGDAPSFLYQFALDPEQEARAAAQRIGLDGRTSGVALFPRNAWGQRVHDAFVSEAAGAGLTLRATQFYDPATQDFSGPLRLALGRYAGAGDRDKTTGKPRSRDAAEEAQSGPQFAFVAAQSAKVARALVPQLRFQMVYTMPVYATSDAWDPSVRAAADLEGLTYPEMPWILFSGQGAPELWTGLHTEGSGAARSRLRLYAFGFDAFRLMREFRNGAVAIGLVGLTGELQLGMDGRVQRTADWARIERGLPQPAPSGPPAPSPRGP
jgi:outer membrane PBP1 activator LpoA protein